MNTQLLQLPQLSIQSSVPIPQKQHLLILGGRPPADRWLQEVSKNRSLWAVDHGLDCLYRNQLLPQHLIGDNDSASLSAQKWCSSHAVPIHQFPTEKDRTDTQLALEIVSKQPDPFAVITGAFGGRFDHAFSTIFSCARADLTCCLADEKEILFFLKNDSSMSIQCNMLPSAISLLPCTAECNGVSINNVHWTLSNRNLPQSLPWAVSNELRKGDSFSVSLKDGILGIYLCFYE